MQGIAPNLWFDSEAEEAGRAMRQMLSMKKLDIAPLKAAYEGKPA